MSNNETPTPPFPAQPATTTPTATIPGAARTPIDRGWAANASGEPLTRESSETPVERVNAAMNTAGAKLSGISSTVGKRSPRLGEAFEQAGRYLQDRDPEAATEDLRELIRQNPGPAIAVGVGVGFLLARMLFK